MPYKNPESERARGRRRNRSPLGRYQALVRAAKDKSLELDITPEIHAQLLENGCFYCQGKLHATGSGLDRKDNTQGYVLDNVVPCCSSCNRVKSDVLSHAEMLVVMYHLKKYRARVA